MNAPTSSSFTDCQSSPYSSRKTNQSFKSWAWALIVFGDRSVSANYRRYRSAGSTTPATPTTVYDTALLAGSNTFDTRIAAPVSCLVDGQRG